MLKLSYDYLFIITYNLAALITKFVLYQIASSMFAYKPIYEYQGLLFIIFLQLRPGKDIYKKIFLCMRNREMRSKCRASLSMMKTKKFLVQ